MNEAQNLFQESEDWRKDFGEGKEMDPVKAEQVAELYPRYYHGQLSTISLRVHVESGRD